MFLSGCWTRMSRYGQLCMQMLAKGQSARLVSEFGNLRQSGAGIRFPTQQRGAHGTGGVNQSSLLHLIKRIHHPSVHTPSFNSNA